MESHPVDIDVDPEQVVRWLIVERQESGSGLHIRASGINDTGAIEPRTEDRFGNEEREDLNEEVAVAKPEVTPTHAGEGWRLVVSVEGRA